MFSVNGDAEEAATMTKTGERILIGVPITLLIILFISQIDWAKGPGIHGQLQDPGQVVLTDAEF